MARTSTPGSPGLSELIGVTDVLIRDLHDSYRAIRILSEMPPDPRRAVAIESEHARARDLYTRYLDMMARPADTRL